MENVVICPQCNAEMIVKEDRDLRYADGSQKYFYACPRYPRCKARMGRHQDGTPYGTGVSADKATLDARHRAHRAFDQFWQKGLMSRNVAYVKLQGIMGMTPDQAHISNFTIAECQRLIDFIGNAELRGNFHKQKHRMCRVQRRHRMNRRRDRAEDDRF